MKKSQIITTAFYLLVVIAISIYIASNWRQLTSQNFAIDWFYIILAIIVGLSALYWGIFTWFFILRFLGAQKIENKKEMSYVYAKSWLGRYIPGTAPWILGKIYFASKLGVSRAKLATSSVLEALIQLVVSLSVALFMISLSAQVNQISTSITTVAIAGVVLCIIILVPPVFNRIISFIFHLLKKRGVSEKNRATPQLLAGGAGLYLVSAVLNGLAMFFIAKAVVPTLGYNELAFIMGASLLAGAIGMMAIFVPSGLGVRDGTQIALLGLIMPLEYAVIIAIISRLWSVCTDLLFFASTLLLSKVRFPILNEG